MEYIYTWVKNIIIFLILVNILSNLVQSANYKKYTKIFTGMVLIIIVIAPISKILNLGNKLDFNFNSELVKLDTRLSDIDFGDIENKKNELILNEYKDEITNQIKDFALKEGLNVKSVDLKINEETSDNNYGKIENINIILTKNLSDSQIKVEKVKKINIKDKTSKNNNLNESISEINIKKALSDFYNISTNNINISTQE